MKTQAEYRKENKILHYQIAEINDAVDEASEEWQNWSDIVDQARVNRILREMLTGMLVAEGKCTEYDSKDYINSLVTQNLNKEQVAMTTQTIKVGNTYPVKVGKNNVEVTVIKQTAKGWMVETAKGKTFPVNNISRFSLPEPKPEPTQSTEGTTSTEPKPKKPMSMLTAAIEVLKQTAQPMNVKEIISAMIESNLWQPGKGKTPHLTLSSAFQRELKKSGDLAPFRKSPERGKFEFIGEQS